MARHGRRGWRGIPTDTLGVWRNIFHAATARGSEKLESQRGQGRVHGHATPRSGQNPGRAHPLLRFEQYVERRLPPDRWLGRGDYEQAEVGRKP